MFVTILLPLVVVSPFLGVATGHGNAALVVRHVFLQQKRGDAHGEHLVAEAVLPAQFCKESSLNAVYGRQGPAEFYNKLSLSAVYGHQGRDIQIYHISMAKLRSGVVTSAQLKNRNFTANEDFYSL